MTDDQGNNIWRAVPRADRNLDAPPSMPTEAVPLVDDEPLLQFSADDGLLPHWSEPPTGQMPAILADEPSPAGDPNLSAWSGFGSQAPVWRDDRSAAASGLVSTDFSYLDSGARPGALDESPLDEDPFLEEMPDEMPSQSVPRIDQKETLWSEPVSTVTPAVAPVGRERKLVSPKVTSLRPESRSGAAPPPPVSAVSSSPAPPKRGEQPRRPGAPRIEAVRTPQAKPAGRNMPQAFGVGVGLLVVFAAAYNFGPQYLLLMVVAVLGVAAVEFFETVRRQGYQPAKFLGIVSVIGLPLAAYWRGSDGVAVCLMLAMIATLVSFMVSGSIESNPLPNTAATMLGIVYIGLLGSSAGLILGQFGHGSKTLVLAVVGTALYDIGGLVVGSSAGRRPLIEWISPNKTWEGLIGGFLAAFLGVFFMAKFGKWAPWDAKALHGIQLALTIAIAAPLGDLAESMLKRSLGVKDFGNILPGHGGVLDRFDCYLFVLPAVYIMSRVLNVY